MMTILWIVIILAFVLYYRERKKDKTQAESTENQAPDTTEQAQEEVEEEFDPPIPEGSFIVWRDNRRALWMDAGDARLYYKGNTWCFSCQPQEPMTIIQTVEQTNKIYIHNAFDVNAECQLFKDDPNHFTGLINGHYLNAELFCRLITAAIDLKGDMQVDDAEKKMTEQLRKEKGAAYLPVWPRDFHCEKTLYLSTDVLLGHFATPAGNIYALEVDDLYYYITDDEHNDYMQFPERRKWKNKEEMTEWYNWHLKDRTVICKKFYRKFETNIPFFTLNDIKNITKK